MRPINFLGWTLLGGAVVFLIYRLAIALRLYLQFRGKRLVACPENLQMTAVSVDAGSLALQSLTGIPRVRVNECSRWPERKNCGQECLRDIETAPEDCLIWNVVNQWYAGKTCAVCQKPFNGLHWHDHRPALLDANQVTVQWLDVSPEKLPEVLTTHRPVCWDCHITESFLRKHPELVVEKKRN